MLCFVIIALVVVKMVQCTEYTTVLVEIPLSLHAFLDTTKEKCPHDQVFRRFQSLRLQTTCGNDRRLLMPFRN